MKIIGILLLAVGIGLTIFTTAQYFTHEKVADLGNVEITNNKSHNLSWSPLVGLLVIGVGGLVLWQSTKKST